CPLHFGRRSRSSVPASRGASGRSPRRSGRTCTRGDPLRSSGPSSSRLLRLGLLGFLRTERLEPLYHEGEEIFVVHLRVVRLHDPAVDRPRQSLEPSLPGEGRAALFRKEPFPAMVSMTPSASSSA